MKSRIANDRLKLSMDGHTENQLVNKMLLQVSVREIHKSMAIKPAEGGLKEARDKYNNIIISDSAPRNILPPQPKNISAHYNVMCG